MIKCRYYSGVTSLQAAQIDCPPEDAALIVTLSNESIGELHHILRRALNCEDPQKFKDWVELCDRLDALKASEKI